MLAYLLHGMAIGGKALAFYASVTPENDAQRVNVFAFTFSCNADLAGFFQEITAFGQGFLIRSFPERMVDAHSQPPISHSAFRIVLGDFREGFFRRRILK